MRHVGTFLQIADINEKASGMPCVPAGLFWDSKSLPLCLASDAGSSTMIHHWEW